MNAYKAATLTGSLLVAKGDAAPIGSQPSDRHSATIQSLPRSAARRPMARRDDGFTHLSLRINSVRHLRLRLAAAQLGYSGNSLVVAALDHYLDHVLPTLLEGKCPCLEKRRDLNHACAAAALAHLNPDHRHES